MGVFLWARYPCTQRERARGMMMMVIEVVTTRPLVLFTCEDFHCTEVGCSQLADTFGSLVARLESKKDRTGDDDTNGAFLLVLGAIGSTSGSWSHWTNGAFLPAAGPWFRGGLVFEAHRLWYHSA